MYNVTLIIDRGPSLVVVPFNPLWSHFLLLFTIVDCAYVVESHGYY
jgi:hypothetical protein